MLQIVGAKLSRFHDGKGLELYTVFELCYVTLSLYLCCICVSPLLKKLSFYLVKEMFLNSNLILSPWVFLFISSIYSLHDPGVLETFIFMFLYICLNQILT